MKIEHLAIWVDDLERMRQFYLTYFDVTSSEKYSNENKGFASYFLMFGDGKTRLELMNRKDVINEPDKRGFMKGIAHFAISVGGWIPRSNSPLKIALYSPLILGCHF